MWVPGQLAYVFAALCLVVRLLRESEQRVVRRETAAARPILADTTRRPGWEAT
jgi:hypothetical protein